MRRTPASCLLQMRRDLSFVRVTPLIPGVGWAAPKAAKSLLAMWRSVVGPRPRSADLAMSPSQDAVRMSRRCPQALAASGLQRRGQSRAPTSSRCSLLHSIRIVRRSWVPICRHLDCCWVVMTGARNWSDGRSMPVYPCQPLSSAWGFSTVTITTAIALRWQSIARHSCGCRAPNPAANLKV